MAFKPKPLNKEVVRGTDQLLENMQSLSFASFLKSDAIRDYQQKPDMWPFQIKTKRTEILLFHCGQIRDHTPAGHSCFEANCDLFMKRRRKRENFC